MALSEKHLAQARENSTSAVSVYSPPANTKTIIKNITVCNQTGATVACSIFLDNDGTTYDQSTALVYGRPIYAYDSLILDTYWVMDNDAGNLAYQSDAANALTITLSGAEIS